MTVIDLFAGPGGFDLGARMIGLDPVGIELDEDACQTRHAAGLRTIQADASCLPLPARLEVDGLIASPPCPDFSTAGKGAGITGESGRLMWTVPRFVERHRPRWVACENVPPALPWWAQFAEAFRGLGYRTWCGVLNAADFGVPQTRKRAFLLASLDREPHPPLASHSRCPTEGLFGIQLPWVSMADALGWSESCEVVERMGAGMIERRGRVTTPTPAVEPYPTVTTGAHRRHWILDRRQTGAPTVDVSVEPCPTLTGAAVGKGVWKITTGNNTTLGRGDLRRYERNCDEPAPTLDTNVGSKWTVHDPDTRRIKLSEREGLILQGFEPDYPIQGRTKASRWRQIGNACPPPLAAAVLSGVVPS